MQPYIGGWRAARIVGVRYRTLDSWVRTGLLPVERPAAGKGTRRGFSFLDLLRAKTVAYLRREGVSLQRIRRVVEALTQHWAEHDPLAKGARLVILGDRLLWARDDEELLDALTGQLAAAPLILPVGAMAQELREKLERAA